MSSENLEELPRKVAPVFSFSDVENPNWNVIHNQIPKHFNRYHEPFGGSLSLFQLIAPEDATLSDINREVVYAYRMIRDKPLAVFKAYTKYDNTEERYRAVCKENVNQISYLDRAARLLFLNKAGKTAAYRENHAGHYLVPYGSNSIYSHINRKRLETISKLLSKLGVVIEHASFELCAEKAEAGDFVFLDPPELRLGPQRPGQISFSMYEDDYLKLATTLDRLEAKGVKFMLTCKNDPLLKAMFSKFASTPLGWNPGVSFTEKGFVDTTVDEISIRNYA